MDAQNNLYVAMSEMGTCLRKFAPDGKLLWELRGDFFVDLVCADPQPMAETCGESRNISSWITGNRLAKKPGWWAIP